MLQEILKILNSIVYNRSIREIYIDWVNMVGLSIANVSETNFNTFIEHEEQYKKIVDKYTPTDLEKFAKCVALLVELLENKIDDYLGKMYHELELHNKDLGQFFTPYGVSCAMSKMVINKVKESDKVITVYEPTCGVRVIIMIQANSQVNTRVLELLPKFKIKKMNRWCAV